MAPMTRLDGGFDRALDDLDLRIVTRSPVLDYLHRLLDEYRELDEGQVATYIPELGRADPNWFGICVVTADGHVYEVGDTDLDFTIQSISKPFVFGLALEDCGRDQVLEHVGVEPSGNAFNSIVVDDRNRPFNPMVNAGAIVATGLIRRATTRPGWSASSKRSPTTPVVAFSSTRPCTSRRASPAIATAPSPT